jgi:hypothetical protein
MRVTSLFAHQTIYNLTLFYAPNLVNICKVLLQYQEAMDACLSNRHAATEAVLVAILLNTA